MRIKMLVNCFNVVTWIGSRLKYVTLLEFGEWHVGLLLWKGTFFTQLTGSNVGRGIMTFDPAVSLPFLLPGGKPTEV